MNNCHNQSFRKSDLKHLRPHISQYFFSAIRKKEQKKNPETQARNSYRYWLDLQDQLVIKCICRELYWNVCGGLACEHSGAVRTVGHSGPISATLRADLCVPRTWVSVCCAEPGAVCIRAPPFHSRLQSWACNSSMTSVSALPGTTSSQSSWRGFVLFSFLFFFFFKILLTYF